MSVMLLALVTQMMVVTSEPINFPLSFRPACIKEIFLRDRTGQRKESLIFVEIKGTVSCYF